MTRKNARLATLVSAIAGAVVLIPVAQASANTVDYTSTLSTATLSSGGGYPNPGGTALLGGAITAKPFGEGATVSHVKMTGHPSPNVFEFKGRETVFYARGTQRDKFVGSSTVNDDGSLDIVINGTFKGGTGRYKGATGHYMFSGRAESGSTVVNGRSGGTITY